MVSICEPSINAVIVKQAKDAVRPGPKGIATWYGGFLLLHHGQRNVVGG